jgi:ABC-type branched-subunit amino acid transport system ATPase component
MNIVSAKGLTKDYGSLRAIDNINFDILKGECFGFLGPNGAGKTTAMSIIYCFMPPTSGEVMVFNMDVMKDPGRRSGQDKIENRSHATGQQSRSGLHGTGKYPSICEVFRYPEKRVFTPGMGAIRFCRAG